MGHCLSIAGWVGPHNCVVVSKLLSRCRRRCDNVLIMRVAHLCFEHLTTPNLGGKSLLTHVIMNCLYRFSSTLIGRVYGFDVEINVILEIVVCSVSYNLG